MRGIMRAPSQGANFGIKYSGTPAMSDCILLENFGDSPRVGAYYDGTGWVYEDDITNFSDENNIISFVASSIYSHAAFIPGPNHD